MPSFFQKVDFSEYEPNKDAIFYRNKYNEIINYIKAVISDSENLEFHKYFKPKGSLLISCPRGTDIIDFLRLITHNYYLDVYELDPKEIVEHSEEFLDNFAENVLDFHGKVEEKANQKEKKDLNVQNTEDKEEISKKIILVEEKEIFRGFFGEKKLLTDFIIRLGNLEKNHKFLEHNLLLIWVNYDYKEIKTNSLILNSFFDLMIRIPILTKYERETILRNYCERYPEISFDIGAIVNDYTEGWEVVDINNLVQKAVFKHFLNTELNDVSNEITDILIELIESGEYVPITSIKDENLGNKNKKIQNYEIAETSKAEVEQGIGKKEEIEKSRRESLEQKPSDFMINQLYENAASKNFNELVVIIDKLEKNEPLEENDRKIISNYSFILNEKPSMAQIYLEKAKRRVDMIKQAFGK